MLRLVVVVCDEIGYFVVNSQDLLRSMSDHIISCHIWRITKKSARKRGAKWIEPKFVVNYGAERSNLSIGSIRFVDEISTNEWSERSCHKWVQCGLPTRVKSSSDLICEWNSTTVHAKTMSMAKMKKKSLVCLAYVIPTTADDPKYGNDCDLPHIHEAQK